MPKSAVQQNPLHYHPHHTYEAYVKIKIKPRRRHTPLLDNEIRVRIWAGSGDFDSVLYESYLFISPISVSIVKRVCVL